MIGNNGKASEPRLPTTRPSDSGMSRARQRRPKTVGGQQLAQGRSPTARRQAAAILEVLAGARTPQQAAEALSVSLPRY